MINHKLHIVLIIIMFILLLISAIGVAQQQEQISSLEKADKTHDEILTFMNEGKRFTYTDGRVLFLMCNGFEADDRVKGRATGIYSEHGETEFSNWLQKSGYIY